MKEAWEITLIDRYTFDVVFSTSSCNDYGIVFGGTIASILDLLCHSVHVIDASTYAGLTKQLTLFYPFPMYIRRKYRITALPLLNSVRLFCNEKRLCQATIHLNYLATKL